MRNTIHLILSILLLISIAFLSARIYQVENEKRLVKEDAIELSKIKYGLFSVDEWKRILADIITRKVEEFDLSSSDREEMRRKISAFLFEMIGDLEKRYYDERPNSLSGFIQWTIASVTGTFDQIKKDIPTFTEQILDFMNEPENREAVRAYIIGQLNAYADSTFANIDYAVHDHIIALYGFEDRNATIRGLDSKILSLDDLMRPYKFGLLALVCICCVYFILFNNIPRYAYLIFTLISFALLVTGVLLPMIEIDARISDMSFSLLGESISFQDQVLYYKSKSILEVVQLMVSQQKFDLLFIGLLVFTFSVLFPISKSISSVIYLYTPRARQSKFIQFMIFKTGKWSMADVMVIAIFMAYIGFTGIITEQLQQIENITQNMDLLTTNKSSLLTGFFAFTSFVILSLLISHKLQYRSKKELQGDVVTGV